MARYRLGVRGSVFDADRGRVIDAMDPDPSVWAEYQSWLGAGNTPDPIVRDAADLDRVRIDRRSALERRVADRYLRDFAAIGTTWRLDHRERAELVALLAAAQAGEGLPTNFAWRDASGAIVTLTEANLRNLVGRFTRRDFLIRSAYWARLASIDASAEPESIDIDDEWTD